MLRVFIVAHQFVTLITSADVEPLSISARDGRIDLCRTGRCHCERYGLVANPSEVLILFANSPDVAGRNETAASVSPG